MFLPKTKSELKALVNDSKVNLGEIDTSLITDMSELFRESSRKDFSGIETWNVSKVKDMSYMFYEAESFNHPLNDWDVSKVKDMSWMFASCPKFNKPLDDWNTSNVEKMIGMFSWAEKFNQNISS